MRVTAKHYGAERSHPVFWGGQGYGEPLWNEAPFKNNQDLFVLKDDYSQVFGNHFIKVGALATAGLSLSAATRHSSPILTVAVCNRRLRR